MTYPQSNVQVTAKTFVLNTQNQILVLRRSKTDVIRPLTWDLPGGAVDYGENPYIAAKRECQEEAGIKPQTLKIFEVTSTNDKHFIISLLFIAHTEETHIKLSYEHDAYKWVSVSDFLTLEIPQKYKEIVENHKIELEA